MPKVTRSWQKYEKILLLPYCCSWKRTSLTSTQPGLPWGVLRPGPGTKTHIHLRQATQGSALFHKRNMAPSHSSLRPPPSDGLGVFSMALRFLPL